MTSCTIEPMAAYPAFVNTIADLAAPSCRIRTLSTSHLKTALSKIHVVVFCRPALEDGHRQGAGRAVHGDGQLRRRIVTNIEHAFSSHTCSSLNVFSCLQANPADVYMDIITGLVAPFTATGTHDGVADLPSLWVAHCAAQRCGAGDIDPLGGQVGFVLTWYA